MALKRKTEKNDKEPLLDNKELEELKSQQMSNEPEEEEVDEDEEEVEEEVEEDVEEYHEAGTQLLNQEDEEDEIKTIDDNGNPLPLVWRKIGKGSFHLNNRIIKPGETFTAYLSEIPEGVRDVVIPLDKKAFNKQMNLGVDKVPEFVFRKEVSKRHAGKFVIVNGVGKPINATPLNEKEADELLTALNG